MRILHNQIHILKKIYSYIHKKVHKYVLTQWPRLLPFFFDILKEIRGIKWINSNNKRQCFECKSKPLFLSSFQRKMHSTNHSYSNHSHQFHHLLQYNHLPHYYHHHLRTCRNHLYKLSLYIPCRPMCKKRRFFVNHMLFHNLFCESKASTIDNIFPRSHFFSELPLDTSDTHVILPYQLVELWTREK